jgi:hypothetical protein
LRAQREVDSPPNPTRRRPSRATARRARIRRDDFRAQRGGENLVGASERRNLMPPQTDLIATRTSDNPCSLYALNILIDTTIGVLILYYLLLSSTHLMQSYFQPLYQTGFYGQPFSLSLWGEQAAVYVACLACMKIVVLVLVWIAPGLEDGMSWCLSWVSSDEAQVFIVMLVLPLVMNLFQFLMGAFAFLSLAHLVFQLTAFFDSGLVPQIEGFAISRS